jgi:hypothetical protein
MGTSKSTSNSGINSNIHFPYGANVDTTLRNCLVATAARCACAWAAATLQGGRGECAVTSESLRKAVGQL